MGHVEVLEVGEWDRWQFGEAVVGKGEGAQAWELGVGEDVDRGDLV